MSDDYLASLEIGLARDDEHRIDEPVEVVSVLQRLLDDRALINVSVSPTVSITTMLWWVDSSRGHIGFSVDADQIGLQQIAAAERALSVAHLENERLQFLIEDMELIHEPQGLALRCSLPAIIVRLQRRKSFRVKTSGFDAPSLRFRMPDKSGGVIVGKVLDISVGGCAVLLPPDAPPFEPGTLFESSRVDLEPANRFVTAFEVRRCSLHETTDGRIMGLILGICWRRLSPESEHLLQRYVNRQQLRVRPQARNSLR